MATTTNIFDNAADLIVYVTDQLEQSQVYVDEDINNDPDGWRNWRIELSYFDTEENEWIVSSGGHPDPNPLPEEHPRRLEWAYCLAYSKAIRDLLEKDYGDKDKFKELIALLDVYMKGYCFPYTQQSLVK
jgi:hypothetical protein